MDAGRIDPASIRTITDSLEIRRLLEKAADSRARALIGFGSDERHEGKLVDLDRATSSLVFSRPASLGSELPAAKSFLVLVFAPGMQALGFHVPALGKDPGDEERMRLKIPAKLFEIQRRRDLRVDIPAGYDLSIKLHSPETRGKRIARKLLDISAGGFSFLITSPEEADRYRMGMFLREVVFEVHGKTILFDAQVMNHVPLGAKGQSHRKKVGCSFLRIQDEDREFIHALCLTRLAPFYLERT